MARRTHNTPALGVSVGAALSDTASVAAMVREARSTATPMRIVGAGTWLDAGRPVRADATLSLATLRGVTEFEPGDFTLTARAGTPIAEIAAVAAREGQWLTLEPYGSAHGTIGATIATGSWGPLASAYGTARDHLLGCEVVTGVGDIVRAGGRVVKNVAGFDLARLMTGAWGTLGVITEVTVRLRARPEVDHTIAIALENGDARRCEDAARWLRSTAFRPLAAELCSAVLAERIGLEPVAMLLVRVGGNEPLVHATERALGELGSTRHLDADVWQRLRNSEPAEGVVVRLGTVPASVADLWSLATRTVAPAGGWCHATLSRGVVRCVLPTPRTAEEIERLRGIIEELRGPGSRIVERLPAPLWADVPSAVADPLSANVRRTFDPDRVLNPGILDPTA
jgi:glycolate oxidase FAD binding subunit